ncbi:hypothetical protein E3J62_02100 [candidate division TA06 bacterium]|uniref:SbsA Ig-like domain-containing protein n=1 Tax=candidate division TA06 bacterium TaxID=2250710 RepID=A0A523UXE8_UNCT6|nr:MAG: hypothetical protein E3J62_02100 [candidate division TA06 bacterium]
MFKRDLSVLAIVVVLLLSGCRARDNVPPRVISTNPQNGAQDVDPLLTEISVSFSEPMMDGNWSWCFEDKDKFPEMTAEPYYTNNNTTNILPVRLEPDKEYVIWINTVSFKNFKDKAENPTGPYKFTFKTR